MEEDGTVESHQFRLLVLESTEIFINIHALTPKYGKVPSNCYYLLYMASLRSPSYRFCIDLFKEHGRIVLEYACKQLFSCN